MPWHQNIIEYHAIVIFIGHFVQTLIGHWQGPPTP